MHQLPHPRAHRDHDLQRRGVRAGHAPHGAVFQQQLLQEAADARGRARHRAVRAQRRTDRRLPRHHQPRPGRATLRPQDAAAGERRRHARRHHHLRPAQSGDAAARRDRRCRRHRLAQRFQRADSRTLRSGDARLQDLRGAAAADRLADRRPRPRGRSARQSVARSHVPGRHGEVRQEDRDVPDVAAAARRAEGRFPAGADRPAELDGRQQDLAAGSERPRHLPDGRRDSPDRAVQAVREHQGSAFGLQHPRRPAEQHLVHGFRRRERRQDRRQDR